METIKPAETIERSLRLWKLPRDYFGAHWDGYYAAPCGQSRDSDCLEKSNWEQQLNALNAIPTPPDWAHDESPWTVVTENHCAVGWVAWLAIHPDAVAHLDCAEELQRRLANYPVLDEEDYCRMEWEECEQVWKKCYNQRERIETLRKDRAVSGFRELRAAVNGDWSAASGLLREPTSIIH